LWFGHNTVVAFSGVKAVEIFIGREHDPQSSDMQTWLPGSDWSRLNTCVPMAAEVEEQPEVYDQAWDVAERVLQENWGAVQAFAEALLEHEALDAAAVRSVLEEAGCVRDEAPIRRVVLEVQGDKLRERLHKLMTESDPENEMEGLQVRIASTDNELEFEVQITYRFGPPPASDAESEDLSMPVVKNGSRS
jgi:hypothetical protein